MEDLYKTLLTEYDAVISVHLSASLSATHEVAWAAAQSVDPQRIHVVNSNSVSVGLGWLAAHAARMAAAGETPRSILDSVGRLAPRLRIILTLETLEYLKRGGRIGRASAFLGGILNVKPVLEIRAGEIHPLERVRTRSASIRRVVQLVREVGPKEEIAIVHGDCRSEAEALRDALLGIEGGSSVPITEVGSVVGTHAGPGVIGIGCLLAG